MQKFLKISIAAMLLLIALFAPYVENSDPENFEAGAVVLVVMLAYVGVAIEILVKKFKWR